METVDGRSDKAQSIVIEHAQQMTMNHHDKHVAVNIDTQFTLAVCSGSVCVKTLSIIEQWFGETY